MTILNFHEWLIAPAQKNKTPEELAKLFIESDFNLPNDQNKTLLHYTADEAFNRNDEFRLVLIKLLFEQKIDTNAIDNNGRTALHDFTAEPHMQRYYFFDNPIADIAEIFFKNGAQFTIKDNEGNTPLDLALQHSDPNSFVIKPLIKFMLLEQPTLPQPNSIDSNERASEYWNIYISNINKLQEQKIPGTECTLYDICAARNLTQLTKQHYPQHKQIQNFDSEDIKNKFYEYSDGLLANLKSLQQGMIKIINTNTVIRKTSLILQKNNLPAIDDVVREIFKHLPDEAIQNMHKAAHPAFFKNKKNEVSKQIDTQEKTTKNSCCIL